jgi:hypothetical protein
MSVRKNILCLALITFVSYGQNHSCISREEAEKILGKPAHLVMSQSETKDNIRKYRCTYSADDKEIAGGQECNLYFLYEEYGKTAAAEKSFKYLLSQNRGMPGIYILADYGDEAVIQTDTMNFQMILVRKSDKMIRMKVNRITSTTSMKELKRVAKEMTDLL